MVKLFPEVATLPGIVTGHGESPVWNPANKRLYLVDMEGCCFYYYDTILSELKKIDTGSPASMLAISTENNILLAFDDGIGFFDESSGNLTRPDVFKIHMAGKGMRFNDGAIDPRGRLLVGSMMQTGDQPCGKLYSFKKETAFTELKQNMLLPNGMAWSVNGRYFFLADTGRHIICRYRYEPETGEIADEKIFVQFADAEFPDGLCADAADGIWVAVWGAGIIKRFDKKGTLVAEYVLPVKHTSSCCFGGPGMNQLFVSTSFKDLTPVERAENPLAGKVFIIDTDTKGMVQPKFLW